MNIKINPLSTGQQRVLDISVSVTAAQIDAAVELATSKFGDKAPVHVDAILRALATTYAARLRIMEAKDQ